MMDWIMGQQAFMSLMAIRLVAILLLQFWCLDINQSENQSNLAPVLQIRRISDFVLTEVLKQNMLQMQNNQ